MPKPSGPLLTVHLAEGEMQASFTAESLLTVVERLVVVVPHDATWTVEEAS